MKLILIITIPIICVFIFPSCLKSSKVNDTKFVLIDYKYGFKNELNTFNDTFIKDIKGRGRIKIKLHLSNSEQDEIINMALRIGFFKMPDTLNVNDQQADIFNDSVIVKENIQSLRIRYKNLDKKIIWRGILPYNNSKAKGLAELTYLIKSIIESKQVYKSLPAMNSGSIQYYFRIVKFLFR
jgi:hypothetical protein